MRRWRAGWYEFRRMNRTSYVRETWEELGSCLLVLVIGFLFFAWLLRWHHWR